MNPTSPDDTDIRQCLTGSEPTRPVSPYLSAVQAAACLNMSYSTFRKKAYQIRRTPGNRCYTREALDEWANALKPKRKPR